MCRKVVFCGICTLCGHPFDWEEFSQELPCLEAKNNGVFGLCSNGVERDEKPHDQECIACEATNGQDEGYAGGMEEFEETLLFVGGGSKGDDQIQKKGDKQADQGHPEQDEGNRRKKKQRVT
ncbi:hypothetical protein QBC35DRAFT_387150 [Podospora australis]|uniref:Uncharacterized protein n=1 Tax=Podospora australis TaxID=1536484 RepID=A0AAN6WUI8_9PEZI|nr:hypothetical protein QBC35DRAFT_387150 [Podospora australis]